MESCGIERGSTHQQWAWFSHKGTAPSLAGPQHTCFWCKLARLCATVSWLEQWDLCWEPRKSCGRPSRGTGEQLPAGGTKESSRAVSKNPNVRGAKCCLEKGLELKVVCLVTVRTYKKCFSFKKWKKKKGRYSAKTYLQPGTQAWYTCPGGPGRRAAAAHSSQCSLLQIMAGSDWSVSVLLFRNLIQSTSPQKLMVRSCVKSVHP